MFTFRRFARLHQLLQDTANAANPPYFAEYQLTLPAPVKISMADYPGLLFYYLVQQGSLQQGQAQQRLYTAWRSREFYSLGGERLRAALHAPPVSVEGLVSHSAVPDRPIWKRQSALTTLLGFTTVLGALEVIRNHYDAFYAAPSLSMRWDKVRAEYTENEEFAESIELINMLPIPHKRIRLTAGLRKQGASAAPAVPVSLSPSVIGYLGVGAKNDITATGQAPRFGKYELVFRISARAGHCADRGEFRFVRPVTVWPNLPKGVLSVHAIAGTTAILRGELYIGPAAANGLDCQVIFTPGSGLEYLKRFDFSGLVANSDRFLHSSSTLPDELASLTWRVHPLPERKVLVFRFALSRIGSTDWKKIAGNARVHCFYREEKIP